VKYLIDTSVISEIRKGARCNANVARTDAGGLLIHRPRVSRQTPDSPG